MRATGLHRLSHRQISKLKQPGKYEDGGGLRLIVDARINRRWVLRVTIRGKRRELGLGSFPSVSLAEARRRSAELKSAAAAGVDQRAQEIRERHANRVTFEEAFWAFFEVKRRSLSSAKYLKQWPSTMRAYVFPLIGHMPVSEIAASDVIATLQPIWYDKPETARRVLQRIEAVFTSAILRGHREKASPCVGIAKELGIGHRTVTHFRALPYQDIGAFIRIVEASRARETTKLCFRFLILTAARSGEARLAIWPEFDRDVRLWVLPAQRMKARRRHVVPLSDQALGVLEHAEQLRTGPLVFPTVRGKALSDMTLTKLIRDLGWSDRCTAHGMRSSFREWCSREAQVPDRIAEAALGHVDKNRVQAAYLRSDFLEERRHLMQAWADYLEGSS